MAVQVFSWNPTRPVLPGRLGRRFGPRRPIDNFGDLLGPVVVDSLAPPDRDRGNVTGGDDRTLFAIGSVLHFARDGDVVWGAGINGKVAAAEHRFTTLDVRAVRGPRTRARLQEMGIEVPEVFGDPGLLTPRARPALVDLARRKAHRLTVLPNLNDAAAHRRHPDFVDPTADLDTVLERIARSELVVGSSLHAVVVAESLGVPARLIASPSESPFKYEDYYLGTGRELPAPAADVDAAVALGGAEPLRWDDGPLVAAFPHDLWARTATAG